MRFLVFILGTALATALNPTSVNSQDRQAAPPDEQAEPYHKHHDTRHGHDHYYPDRGSIVRDLPPGTIGLNYAGSSYRFHDGVWYEPRGPAFIVVDPPIGLVVPSLPAFSTALAARGGDTFLYTNGVYYRPRPDLGGYEVVNDPQGTVSALGSEMLVAPPAPATAPVPVTAAAATAVPVTATVPISPAAATALPATLKEPKVFLYPKNGQSADQQARDRYDCYRFAAAQSGFDPMRGSGQSNSESQSDFERAQAACFDARGYASR